MASGISFPNGATAAEQLKRNTSSAPGLPPTCNQIYPGDKITSNKVTSVPNELLLEIISWIPIVTHDMREAIDSFKALSKTNKIFNLICNKKYTRAVLYKGILENNTHQYIDIAKTARKSSVYFDLTVIKMGYRMHIKEHLHRQLTKIFDLDRQLIKLVSTLVQSANALFKGGHSTHYTLENGDKRAITWIFTSPIQINDLFIRVSCVEVEILTCFTSILIQKGYPKNRFKKFLYSTVHLPVLAIAETLVHRLGATLVHAHNLHQCFELSGSGLSHHQIRKITDQDLKNISNQDINSVINTQKVIVPLTELTICSNWYKIGKVGKTALDSSKQKYVYSHTTLDEICAVFKQNRIG